MERASELHIQRWYPTMDNYCEYKLDKSRMGTVCGTKVPRHHWQLRKNETKQDRRILS